MAHTAGPYQLSGRKCIAVNTLNRPGDYRHFYSDFYRVEAPRPGTVFAEGIAYFKNEDDARLFVASPDLLEACIPFANEATLYLLENFTYRCACCNAEPQSVSACDFEHRSDCPVIKARVAIAKTEGK